MNFIKKMFNITFLSLRSNQNPWKKKYKDLKNIIQNLKNDLEKKQNPENDQTNDRKLLADLILENQKLRADLDKDNNLLEKTESELQLFRSTCKELENKNKEIIHKFERAFNDQKLAQKLLYSHSSLMKQEISKQFTRMKHLHEIEIEALVMNE